MREEKGNFIKEQDETKETKQKKMRKRKGKEK